MDGDMDGVHPHFICVFLLLLQTSAWADICTLPQPFVNTDENNPPGHVLETIITQQGVTIEFTSPVDPNNPFEFRGNDLVTTRLLDYEAQTEYVVNITCNKGPSTLKHILYVFVNNLNDNPPVFALNPYIFSVSEMSPVGTTVGRVAATDRDQLGQLHYRLTSESNYFNLKSDTDPDLLVSRPIDYEKVKSVRMELYVQDTPLTDVRTTFTATTTIVVNISDVDNRPPWFQPCSRHEIGGTVICQSSGYTGKVFLNKQETEILQLEPGPLYAIDGDSGIKEELTYGFLSGDDKGLFQINANTGNITMLQPAVTVETISLTVMAIQKRNSNQFATTTVTIRVEEESLHLPEFQRTSYECVVSGVGSMAMDLENLDQPLKILATDQDYAATGGLNPHITYSTDRSSDFSIINNFLFMMKNLPEGTLSLQVVAKDTSNNESVAAPVTVEVVTGLTTTTLPPSTNSTTTAFTEESTTSSKTTEDTMSTTIPSTSTASSISTTVPSTTSESTVSTTVPSTSTASSISTTIPSTTSESTVSTTVPSTSTASSISTTIPSTTSESTVSTTIPSTFTASSISTTVPSTTSTVSTTIPSTSTGGSVSTTIPSTTSESTISTTNPSLTTDGSVSTAITSTTSESSSTARTVHPTTVTVPSGGYGPVHMAALGATLGVLLFICLVVIGVLVYHMQKGKSDWKKIYEASMFRSSLGKGSGGLKGGIQYTNEAFQNDDDGGDVGFGGPQGGGVMAGGESQKVMENILLNEAIEKSSASPHNPGSDEADNEKEVKPILTKERRMEEGYKAVWFKEDIDPNAKEEVVIIPGNREEDVSEEDDSEDDDNPPVKTSKVSFDDADLDSGVGIKTEDLPEDLTSNL